MANDRLDYVKIDGQKEDGAQPNQKQQVESQEFVEVGEE